MKALFVTKDIRPGMISVPIALEMIKLGWDFSVVAESLSLKAWDEAGLEVLYRGPEIFDSASLWRINPLDVFEREKPDILVSGLSYPINVESLFMEAGKRIGIPVVAIDDNWGSFNRSHIVADLYLTIDRLGKNMIKTSVYKGSVAHVMGDIVLDSSEDEATRRLVEGFREEYGAVVVLLGSGGKESVEVFKIATDSLRKSADRKRRFVVFPRFHPKALGISEDLKRMASSLGDRAVFLEGNFKTESLCSFADVSIGLTGSGLRAAASNRRLPVCVSTQEGAERLLFEGGQDIHPLVSIGAALDLRASSDLFSRLDREAPKIIRAQNKYLEMVPFDPKGATKMIEELAISRGKP